MTGGYTFIKILFDTDGRASVRAGCKRRLTSFRSGQRRDEV